MAQVARSDPPSASSAPSDATLPADRQPVPSHQRPPNHPLDRHHPPQFPVQPRSDNPVAQLAPHHPRQPAVPRDSHPPYNHPASLPPGPQPGPSDLPPNSSDPRFSPAAHPANHPITHPALTPEQQPLIAPPSHSPHHLDTPQSATPIIPIVNTFADMTLGPPHMHYPTPVPLLPLQPQPLVPLVPSHHPNPHPHMPPPRHPGPHHNQPHLLPNQATTVGHWVPKESVGAVIGSHGTVIRSLQEKSGATIQVHNDTIRGEHKLFTVHGLPSQIDTAIQLMMEVVERPRPMSSAGSDRASTFSTRLESNSRQHDLSKTVHVPTSCVGLVIGRNGETIRRLQDKSGAEIKVTPDEDSSPAQQSRSILLTGTEEAITIAQQLVSELVRDARSRRPPYSHALYQNGDPPHVEVLSVPNEKVGLIIGKKGVAIRYLQMRSGAKIQVTKDDSSVHDGSRPVTITGTRPQVESAKSLIADKLDLSYLPPSSAPPQLTPPSRHSYSSSGKHTRGVHLLPNAPNSQGPPYGFQQMYESEYSNGQPAAVQSSFDSSDPNNHPRPQAVTYFPYVGYSNYPTLPQHHRQVPPGMAPASAVPHPGPQPSHPAMSQGQMPGSSQVSLQMTSVPVQNGTDPNAPGNTGMSTSGGNDSHVVSHPASSQDRQVGVASIVGATAPTTPVSGSSVTQDGSNGSTMDPNPPRSGSAVNMFPVHGFASIGDQALDPKASASEEQSSKRSFGATDVAHSQDFHLAGSTNQVKVGSDLSATPNMREKRLGEPQEKPVKEAIRESGTDNVVDNGEG